MAQLLRGCDSPPGIDAIVDAARIEDRCPAAAEVAHLLQGCAQVISQSSAAACLPTSMCENGVLVCMHRNSAPHSL